ncbi:hypothetical protein OUZ56_033730 [Daphnia magna]|uniref:Uncharacterized protein n=1 Tax=Daphnia magna TaxID=35525 RepID=A0ABQ9ZY69_9CRUS|nr:hypothetical protein OUZ56_033730 [Daphnia magna]
MESASHQKAMDRLCWFVAEHNLALSSAEYILQLFKTELSDNPILARATIGKTKTSNYVREAIGKFVTDHLADRARHISVKIKMALVISFWDGKMNSQLLELARCKDATAEGLTTALLDILKESKFPRLKWLDCLQIPATRCLEKTIRSLND